MGSFCESMAKDKPYIQIVLKDGQKKIAQLIDIVPGPPMLVCGTIMKTIGPETFPETLVYWCAGSSEMRSAIEDEYVELRPVIVFKRDLDLRSCFEKADPLLLLKFSFGMRKSLKKLRGQQMDPEDFLFEFIRAALKATKKCRMSILSNWEKYIDALVPHLELAAEVKALYEARKDELTQFLEDGKASLRF